MQTLSSMSSIAAVGRDDLWPVQDYADRKAEQAKWMISQKYLDRVEEAGMDYGVQIAVVKGQRSAAAFADAIVRRAKALNTDLLAVASHGR